jgi:HEAT repeat protein
VTEVLAASVFVLFALLVLLQVTIVVTRIRDDRRRKRIAELRPGIETALAFYVANPEAESPEPPGSELGRLVLREVALEAIVELRGREGERLIGLLEDIGTIDELCDDLLSNNPVERRHAAEALGEMRSPEAADSLLFGVADPDRDSRLACARALAELGEEQYTAPVIDAADEAAEHRPGAAAAVLLAVGMRNPSGIAGALADERSQAGRRLAAAVVTELRLAEHAPLLRAALHDEDDELVSRAARGLGSIGDADAIEDLVSIVEDPERAWFCRAVAAGALGTIGNPCAVPALEELLTSSDRWMMHDRAAGALAQLGEEGHEALTRALRSPVEEVRELAAVAMVA